MATKKKPRKPVKKTIVCQSWIESEAGFGQRPDGVSLHLSMADHDAYLKEAHSDRKGPAPECYDRHDGNPALIDVDVKTYN